LGGHFVQGHVDCTAEIVALERRGADVRLEVALPDDGARYFVEKGSIAVDGISLSGASGSQLVCVVTNGPPTTTTPTLGLVALRFIQAQAGSVRVQGA
jgi:riboflavin synthase